MTVAGCCKGVLCARLLAVQLVYHSVNQRSKLLECSSLTKEMPIYLTQ